LDKLEKIQNRVGPTHQSHGPNRGTQAVPSAFRQQWPPPCPCPRHRHPLFLPTISTTTPPSTTASCSFKRSAPSKSSTFLLLLMPRPCSPRCSALPPLQSTLTPSSAQATPLSRSTVLKHCFHLELAAVKSPRSHPTLCTVSTEGASSTAAISGHYPPSFSPP
jgi:hypothetical protein